MSDIAFLLLLFFLIIAITTRQTPVPIVAAQSPFSGELQENHPTLYLEKNGSLYYEGDSIALDQIPQVDELCLMADKATPFSSLAPVIKALQENGVTTIHCLVEEIDE